MGAVNNLDKSQPASMDVDPLPWKHPISIDRRLHGSRTSDFHGRARSFHQITTSMEAHRSTESLLFPLLQTSVEAR